MIYILKKEGKKIEWSYFSKSKDFNRRVFLSFFLYMDNDKEESIKRT